MNSSHHRERLLRMNRPDQSTGLSALTPRTRVAGETFGAGDFLAQVDPRPYQASLAQARGQLMRDSALLKNAQLDLARYQKLISQDSAAHQALDTARATVSQYEGAVQSDEAQMQIQKLNLEYCRILSPIRGRMGLRQVDAGNFVQPNDVAGLMVITQMQPISVIFVLPQAQLGTVLAAFQHEYCVGGRSLRW